VARYQALFRQISRVLTHLGKLPGQVSYALKDNSMNHLPMTSLKTWALSFLLILTTSLFGCSGGSTSAGSGDPSPPPVTGDAQLDIKLIDGALDFVSDLGLQSAEKRVTIKNAGTSSAQLGTLSSTTADFVVSTMGTAVCANGLILKSGDSCTVGIALKPATLGIKTGNLVVSYNGKVGSSSFPLKGLAYPARALATGAAVTLAGATTDPNTRTTTVTVFPDASTVERLRLNTTFPWSDYRSTGIYAKPAEAITLSVSAAPPGTTVQAWIGLWQQKMGAAAPAIEVNARFVPLVPNTVQTIASPDGGPLYVRAVNNAAQGGTVKFQVLQGGTPMPLFLLGRDTHAQWLAAVNATTVTPYVEVVSKRTILTFNTDKVRAALALDPSADIARTVSMMDQMVASHDAVAGIDGSSAPNMPRDHPLHYTPQDIPNYYMFAYFSRTAYCLACAEFLFTKSFVLDGWGPWHETGHMYQGGWEWSDLSEVSVNLFSLEFQKALGAPNRLIAEISSVPGVNFWDHALQQRPTLTAFDKLEVFERLVMFWQLRLNYGDKFWPALHKLYRDPLTRPAFTDDESRRQNFILMASRAANQDLRAFFAAWSLRSGAATDAAVQALRLPVANVNALLALRPQ
jgi:Peptidase M60, enhancin and enhancin-like/N-terminal domain of M60-like peptidases